MRLMRRALTILLCLQLAACTTLQPVSLRGLEPGAAPGEVREGDRVEVVTTDRERFEFTVEQIDGLGIGGKFGFIPWERVSKLGVRRPGGSAEDFYWVWALVGAAVIVAVVANADSVRICSPGPCPNP